MTDGDDLLKIATGSPARPRPASRSRPTSPGRRTPTSGSTRARSSTSPRPRPRASASGSSATAAVGFAYAGTLDDDAVAEVLAEARDNVAFGTPDEWAGLAEPDGVPVADARPVARRAASTFPTDGQGRAGDGARAADAGRGPPRPGRGGRVRRRPWARRPSPPPPASARPAGRPAATCRSARWPTRATRPRPASASRSAAARRPRRRRRRPREAAERATRLLGATKPATGRRHRRARPVRHRAVPRHPRSTLNGESVLKGRSLFADRVGEEVASPLRHPGRRPDQPARLHGDARSTARAWPPGATSSSTAACCRGSCRTPTAAGAAARPRPATPSRGFKSTPACGCLALSLRPGTREPGRADRRRRRRRAHPEGAGLHSGVNPVVGRLLDRRLGPA